MFLRMWCFFFAVMFFVSVSFLDMICIAFCTIITFLKEYSICIGYISDLIDCLCRQPFVSLFPFFSNRSEDICIYISWLHWMVFLKNLWDRMTMHKTKECQSQRGKDYQTLLSWPACLFRLVLYSSIVRIIKNQVALSNYLIFYDFVLKGIIETIS